jgi:hypothetical protein
LSIDTDFIKKMTISSGEVGPDSPMRNNKQPLLYVDVNLGPGKSERIIVYDGDTADRLAEGFARRHNLDDNMKMKLA